MVHNQSVARFVMDKFFDFVLTTLVGVVGFAASTVILFLVMIFWQQILWGIGILLMISIFVAMMWCMGLILKSAFDDIRG